MLCCVTVAASAAAAHGPIQWGAGLITHGRLISVAKTCGITVTRWNGRGKRRKRLDGKRRRLDGIETKTCFSCGETYKVYTHGYGPSTIHVCRRERCYTCGETYIVKGFGMSHSCRRNHCSTCGETYTGSFHVCRRNHCYTCGETYFGMSHACRSRFWYG